MDLPPQVLKQEVRDLAASQDLAALRSGAALETFGPRWPVLQAFQEFLEIERRQARRRLLRMAAAFLALLVLVIAGGLFTLVHLNGRMRRDVQALEAALASARTETSSLRGNTEALQTAMQEAQRALETVRQQLADGSPVPAPSIDLSGMASSLGLLQETHRLRSEHFDLAGRQAALQGEISQWEAEQRATVQLREKLLAQREALRRDVAAYADRQQDLTRRLHQLRESAPLTRVDATAAVQRGGSSSRGGKAAALAVAPDPVAALALLQEIYRLRGEQPALALRQSSLESGWNELELAQQELQARRERVATARAALAPAVEAFRARQQDLQTRLASVR
jgi:chromosome segregation ATPase